MAAPSPRSHGLAVGQLAHVDDAERLEVAQVLPEGEPLARIGRHLLGEIGRRSGPIPGRPAPEVMSQTRRPLVWSGCRWE